MSAHSEILAAFSKYAAYRPNDETQQQMLDDFTGRNAGLEIEAVPQQEQNDLESFIRKVAMITAQGKAFFSFSDTILDDSDLQSALYDNKIMSFNLIDAFTYYLSHTYNLTFWPTDVSNGVFRCSNLPAWRRDMDGYGSERHQANHIAVRDNILKQESIVLSLESQNRWYAMIIYPQEKKINIYPAISYFDESSSDESHFASWKTNVWEKWFGKKHSGQWEHSIMPSRHKGRFKRESGLLHCLKAYEYATGTTINPGEGSKTPLRTYIASKALIGAKIKKEHIENPEKSAGTKPASKKRNCEYPK